MRTAPRRVAAGRAFLPALLPALWLVSACSSGPPSGSATPGPAPTARLEEISELIGVAAASFDPYGPVESNRRSLESARAALDVDGAQVVASFYAARAASWLLEFDPDLPREQALVVAQEGRSAAEIALAADEGDVRNVFLAGALLGQELRLNRSPGLVKLRRVHDYFEQAVAMDPSYDDGAPFRALGTLLVKAPPWPVGVGDEERGLELLEEGAERFPAHPASHLFLGDAQTSAARQDDAARSYERVLALCEDPRWGSMCATYGPRAGAALDKIR